MKMTKHEFSAATQYQLLLAGDWSGENVFTIPRITFHCLKLILHHNYCGHNVVVLLWVQALAAWLRLMPWHYGNCGNRLLSTHFRLLVDFRLIFSCFFWKIGDAKKVFTIPRNQSPCLKFVLLSCSYTIGFVQSMAAGSCRLR